jgi:uncharacterized membrane protein
MWILLALISAILAAARRTQEKRITAQFNHFTIGFAVQLVSLPIIGIAMLLHGVLLNPFHLGARFWLPLIITSVGFYPLNAFLYLQAIKQSELSSVLPIQSLWPVLSLIPAWLTLGEVPSVLGVVGILLTVAGVYALGLKGKSLHHPFQPFRESQSSRYMLMAVILVTIAGVLDKIAIPASDAIYYSFASTIGAVIALLTTLRVLKINEWQKIRTVMPELGRIGTLQGISYTTYLMAIAAGPLAYVASVRSSNVLMGSLLGIVLLHERFTKAKMLSFCLIASGGVLLAFN